MAKLVSFTATLKQVLLRENEAFVNVCFLVSLEVLELAHFQYFD